MGRPDVSELERASCWAAFTGSIYGSESPQERIGIHGTTGEEFEVVPIDETSDHAFRACRDCEREQRGLPKTRPCPQCGESIVLFHWPRHVSNCSGSTSGPRDSDPATDPGPNTNAEQTAPADDRTEQHAD